jgi:AraC family transcriptional regulator
MSQDEQQHLGAAAGPPRRRLAAIGGARVELLPRMAYDVAYTPEAAVIGFAFEAQAGSHAFATDRVTDFRTRPNSLAYVPKGCDVVSRSHQGGEYLTLTAPFALSAGRSVERRFNDFINPAAIKAAQDLRRLLLAGDVIDTLEAETSVAALCSAVANVLTGGAAASRATGWMTARRIVRVDEIIEARMDAGLTVQEIAGHLGLSSGFFNRAFKAATGKTPHDYIVDRRISRARLLLRRAHLGLADIAAASGFASHAHMTSQFTRRLGISPSRLRDPACAKQLSSESGDTPG